ncbi:MAG TPA: hypothetical protein DEA71_02645, partial [Nitrospira sp.]|nr:hypothetical protein [Nitrospira sp.]
LRDVIAPPGTVSCHVRYLLVLNENAQLLLITIVQTSTPHRRHCMKLRDGARKRSASIRQSFKMSQAKYHEDIMKKTNQIPTLQLKSGPQSGA